MTVIHIPRDDAEARARADLATLTEWELAGYVASQVTLDNKPGPRSVSSDRSLTPAEFAAKGIRGLRSKNTVQVYAERWRDALGDAPRPGETIHIPDDLDWPPTSTDRVGWGVGEEDRRAAIREQAERDGTGPAKAVDIASNTKAMAAAIKADPKTAEAARVALAIADEAKHAKAVIEAGGNPDIPLDAPGDSMGIELRHIEARVNVLISDAEKILNRAEADEQPRLRAIFERSAIRITGLAYGKVPDSLEGIER